MSWSGKRTVFGWANAVCVVAAILIALSAGLLAVSAGLEHIFVSGVSTEESTISGRHVAFGLVSAIMTGVGAGLLLLGGHSARHYPVGVLLGLLGVCPIVYAAIDISDGFAWWVQFTIGASGLYVVGVLIGALSRRGASRMAEVGPPSTS